MQSLSQNSPISSTSGCRRSVRQKGTKVSSGNNKNEDAKSDASDREEYIADNAIYPLSFVSGEVVKPSAKEDTCHNCEDDEDK